MQGDAAARGELRTPPDVAALVRLLLADVEDLTARLVAAILAEDPTYAAGDAVLRPDLERSCRTNLEHLLQALTGDLDPRVDALDAPRATGARRAEQGVPLESVLHAYRLGYRTIWEGLVQQARTAPGPSRVESLVDAASVVWEIVDVFSSAVADSYRRTEADLARRQEHRREEALDAVLEGRGGDRAVAAASAAALDLPEHGPYAVLALPGSVSPRAAVDALSVRGLRSACRERADRGVVVVSLGAAAPAEVREALQVVPGVRAGLSPVVDGLAQVDVGQALAQTALRALPPGTTGVVTLDEVLPGALLVTAPDLARRLVDRVLGALLALDPAERDLLLETVRAWLASGGSAARTAGALYCHRNTVLNRLRRVEALTGRSLERADHLVDCALALQALDVVGPGHRPGAPDVPPA